MTSGASACPPSASPAAPGKKTAETFRFRRFGRDKQDIPFGQFAAPRQKEKPPKPFGFDGLVEISGIEPLTS